MAHKNIVIFGDSIGGGFGDTDVDKGYIMRGLEGQPNVGVLNLCRGGDRLRWLAQAPQSQRFRRWRFAVDATDVLIPCGINDITASSFNQASDLQGFMTSILTNLQNLGVPRIWFFTPFPNPTTTDKTITLAGQTANATTEAVRIPLLAWMRSTLIGLGAHLIDATAIIESAPNSGLWKVPGTVGVGDITSGSATVANCTLNVPNGTVISGTGLPQNVSVLSGGGTATLTLSAPATQTATARAIGVSYSLDTIHPNVNGHTTLLAGAMAPILTA